MTPATSQDRLAAAIERLTETLAPIAHALRQGASWTGPGPTAVSASASNPEAADAQATASARASDVVAALAARIATLDAVEAGNVVPLRRPKGES